MPRPSQRKKWKKTVLQLVPVGPPAPPTTPASSQEQANPLNLEMEAATKPENSDSGESMKLKLPRAMRSASSNGSNLLRERNADQSGGESVGNGGFVQNNSGRASGSRTSDEKENHTRRI